MINIKFITWNSRIITFLDARRTKCKTIVAHGCVDELGIDVDVDLAPVAEFAAAVADAGERQVQALAGASAQQSSFIAEALAGQAKAFVGLGEEIGKGVMLLVVIGAGLWLLRGKK